MSDLGYTQISFASSLLGLEMGIFAPVLGFFVDRLGSWKLIMAGTSMIGIVMGSGSVGGIMGPTLAGWTFDTRGSYRWVWLLVWALTVIASGLVCRIMPSDRT